MTAEKRAWLLRHSNLTFDDPDKHVDWPWRGELQPIYCLLSGDRRINHPVRIMCEFAHGPPPKDKPWAVKTCDDDRCLNAHHVKWMSDEERADHRRQKGRMYGGAVHHNARLQEGDVRDILASKLNERELAAHYGVHRTTIIAIRTGRSWKHVHKDYMQKMDNAR